MAPLPDDRLRDLCAKITQAYEGSLWKPCPAKCGGVKDFCLSCDDSSGKVRDEEAGIKAAIVAAQKILRKE